MVLYKSYLNLSKRVWYYYSNTFYDQNIIKKKNFDLRCVCLLWCKYLVLSNMNVILLELLDTA